MLPHMRRTLLLLVCLALAPGVRAAAEDEAAFVDLAGCTVLASPGTPEGLHPFLPRGQAPAPLTWPLPDGPLLILGLPGRDDAARDLAFFWNLLGPGEDLHGGYLVAAWHDGKRPIAVILGDDAAALYVARFELEAGPERPGMQVLDFTKPPAETGLRIRQGRRLERARFRIRAYYPRRERVSSEAVLTAIAGRANRFWIDLGRQASALHLLPQLVRYGVVPCIVLHVPEGHEPLAARRVEPWIRRGVRHLVLSPAEFEMSADDVGRHVEHLRSVFDLDEVVVSSADYLRVPSTLSTWYPGPAASSRIHSEQARTAVASAGVPLLFVDTWARVSRTPVPSRPRGRPPELGRLFRGVIVPDGPGALEVLEDAWRPRAEESEEWESVLLPLLPRREDEPRTFLERSAERLATLDPATRLAVGWLDPLLGRVRSHLGELHERAVLVPRIPAPVHLDGVLDEPAWAHAGAMEFPVPQGAPPRSGVLLAASDGRDLRVAVRLPADVPPLRLVVSCSATGPERGAWICDGARPHAGAMRRSDTTRTWEGTLDHFDLSGDAHPLRVLHLWHIPTEGSPQRLGSLVLGP